MLSTILVVCGITPRGPTPGKIFRHSGDDSVVENTGRIISIPDGRITAFRAVRELSETAQRVVAYTNGVILMFYYPHVISR